MAQTIWPELPKGSPTYGEGRLCEVCSEPVSRYNPEVRCFAHREMLPPVVPVRGRRLTERCLVINQEGSEMLVCRLDPGHRGDHEWV